MIMAEGIRFQSNEQGIKKLSNLNTILLDKDNKIIQISNTKNLMGNPLKVLMWLITEFNKKQKIIACTFAILASIKFICFAAIANDSIPHNVRTKTTPHSPDL